MPHTFSAVLAKSVGPGNGPDCQWVGGKGVMSVQAGNWNAGSVKLQVMGPTGAYTDYPSSTLMADGSVSFELPQGMIRVVVTLALAVNASAARVN